MNLRNAGIVLVVLLSTLGYTTARAELKWEQTILELHPAIGDKQAIGQFKYENVGTTPIRFKSVHSSCGCTTTQSQKDEIPPGQKGEITATFNIGDRTGTQVKTVSVETDDPAHPSLVLTLKAVLPEMLTITPTFIYWTANEDATPKTILVKAGKGFAAKKLTVTSSNPDFLTKVEGEEGEWKINVQPKQTTRAMAGALTIQSDFPKDAPRIFMANMSVTGAPPQSAAVGAPK
jgi:hypothetical protein